MFEKKENLFDWVLSALGLLGFGFMAYLFRLHGTESSTSVCDISSEISCTIVNKSIFSEILNIPVAALGLIFFATVLYLILLKPVKHIYRIILLAVAFSLTFGVYLTGIEKYVLGSFCLFCEASKLIMIGIAFVSGRAVVKFKEPLPPSWPIGAVLAGIVFSYVAYTLQV